MTAVNPLWPEILRHRRRVMGYESQEALAAASAGLTDDPDQALTQRVISYIETGKTNPAQLGGARLLVYLRLLDWTPEVVNCINAKSFLVDRPANRLLRAPRA